MAKKSESWSAIGRRKSSVARVRMDIGKGIFIVNNRPIENYFGRDILKMMLRQPLELMQLSGKYNITVKVNGGGLSGQAGAIRHGISKALNLSESELRQLLKKEGFLKRDSRIVERKKYGRRKARRKYQFSKR